MNLFKLVTSNIFRRKGRFAFTLLGISIGMASFVALLSIGGNMQSAVKQQAEGLGANFLIMPENICIYNQMAIVTGETISELLQYDVYDSVKDIDEITVIPHLTQKTAIRELPSVIAGILPEETLLFKDWTLAKGEYFTSQNGNAAVIGTGFATTRELNAGDSVTVRGEELTIKGILTETGGNDDMTMFIPLHVAQRIFDKEGYISYMSAKVADMTKMEFYEAEILSVASVQVATNDQLLASVLSILGSVNSTLQLIAGVALIAAAFGIINTMMTAVYERRREIGILRAIGGKKGFLFKIFLLESGLYGFLGGIVGVVVGYAVSIFAAPIINRDELSMLKGVSAQADIDIHLVVTAVGVSLLISIFSGLYPAWRAAQLTPMEAISS
ncbi:MAG: ABC transporter permease [Oscillospiraceae bacterium]|nr:ABC transporter permease [Oscillospiraceae bacterium]